MLLLEKIYLSKLEKYINSKNILSKYQFGFRRHHSTDMAIIAVTDYLKKTFGSKSTLRCDFPRFSQSI